MSRNGSGTYAKVNTFTAGSTITASGHNQNWDDIAAEMTNSVAADGQTTMTGPLKLSSGSASIPALAFGSDLDTGIYRIGSNNLGVSIGGSKVIDVTSSATNFVNAIKQNGFVIQPVGSVIAFAGSTAPSGWLMCDGSAVSRTTYADLFAVIGTTYGSGDGSTTFNVPDLRGRVIAGKDDMGGSAASHLSGTSITTGGATTLGGSGGAETKTLLTANLPPYTPAGSVSSTLNATGLAQYGAGGGTIPTSSNANGPVNPTITSTFTGTAQGGSSTPFALVQPTLILNQIIYAGA